MKKKILISIACLITLIVVFFVVRDQLYKWALTKVVNYANNKYHIQTDLTGVNVLGFSSIQIGQITVKPQNGCDTLLLVRSMYAEVNPWQLLSGIAAIDSLTFDDGFIKLVNKKGCCNYQLNDEKNRKESTVKTWSHSVSKLLTKLIAVYDFKFQCNRIAISYTTDSVYLPLQLTQLRSSSNSCSFVLIEKATLCKWQVKSSLVNKQTINLSVQTLQKGNTNFLQKMFKGVVRFDDLQAQLTIQQNEEDNVQLLTQLKSNNLSIYHKRISTDTIKIAYQAFQGTVQLQGNSFKIVPDGKITINELYSSIKASFEKKDSLKKYALEVHTDNVAANTFIKSLPKGMFKTLDGIDCKGQLQFNLNFSLVSNLPDSCQFYCELKPTDFAIKSMGTTNLAKMNGSFTHAIYEKDQYIRSIVIGYENPLFYDYLHISPFIKSAILTNEDGDFFWHQGFNEESFRKSIAENYKAGRFVRGGSTISMQLVKNIFLSRNKTISRKAEEAFIVWLIEHQRLSSKERMFEVYLNSIEFGPNVYGIGEASKFYFNKRPVELTLAESIFLSIIIPRPKYFKYNFDEYGNLRPFIGDYYRFISRVLLHRKLITENEYNDLKPQINIVGPARKYILKKDSIPTDFEEVIKFNE